MEIDYITNAVVLSTYLSFLPVNFRIMPKHGGNEYLQGGIKIHIRHIFTLPTGVGV